MNFCGIDLHANHSVVAASNAEDRIVLWLLWCAVNEPGAELDILLPKRRDRTAAKRFFKRVMRSCATPRKIVTDRLRS
jgi:hypothetical protein